MSEPQTTFRADLDCWIDNDGKSKCPYCMKEHDVDCEDLPHSEDEETEVLCPECEKPYMSVGFVAKLSRVSRRLS